MDKPMHIAFSACWTVPGNPSVVPAAAATPLRQR